MFPAMLADATALLTEGGYARSTTVEGASLEKAISTLLAPYVDLKRVGTVASRATAGGNK